MKISLNLGVTDSGEMSGMSLERLASRGAEALRHLEGVKGAIRDPWRIEREIDGVLNIHQKWDRHWQEYHQAPSLTEIGMNVEGTPMAEWIERSPKDLEIEMQGKSVRDWARIWYQARKHQAEQEVRLESIPMEWDPENLADGEEYFVLRTEDQGDWIIRAIPDLIAVAGTKSYLPLRAPNGKCHIVANSGRVAPLPEDSLHVIQGALMSNQLASLWPVMPAGTGR